MHGPRLLALPLFATLVACSPGAADIGAPDQPDEPTQTEPTTTVEGAPSLPAEPYDYATLDLPDHFYEVETIGPFTGSSASMDNEPADNPVTDDGATLGRVLFYDVDLSQNRTTACASCHQQAHGFADPEALSFGFEGGLTGRHSMGLSNARFYDRGHFFWDERAETLEDQVLMPLQDATEMGMTLEEVVARVEEQGFYAELFEAAFGDSKVSSDRIARALAQFVRSLVSASSRYDVARANAASRFAVFPEFSPAENRGKQIFYGDGNGPPGACGGCHIGEVMSQLVFFNNGLDSEADSTDLGAFETTPLPPFLAAFKAPSLRNIAVRPPYMHDGRFDTLAQVVDHYSEGIQLHPNLGPGLRTPDGQPVQLNLSPQDKLALIAFLETLTDDAFLQDPRFSDPFEE